MLLRFEKGDPANLDSAKSLRVLTFSGTRSSDVKPISWNAEITEEKPPNLIVPLINVSQSCMPNLSMKLIKSLRYLIISTLNYLYWDKLLAS